MFSNKNTNVMEKNNQQNVLAVGAEITGDIITKGPFRVDGVIKGSLKAGGKVVVGKQGAIHGTLEGENADFEGVFSGEIVLSGVLSLKSTAKIEGEVQIAKLVVEPGAIFNANCKMNGGAKAPKKLLSKT